MLTSVTQTRLWTVAVLVTGAVIFFLDMTPIQAAGDGAGYGIVIALAAVLGRRAVVITACVAGFFTVLAPLVGAEPSETFLQMIVGRAIAFATVVVFTAVLLRLLDRNGEIAASDAQISAHQSVLNTITKLALVANKLLQERLHIITEATAGVLGIDRVSVGRMEAGRCFRFYDIWDRRLGSHMGSYETPVCLAENYDDLLGEDLVSATEDVRLSPAHQKGIAFFDKHAITAVLHVASAYHDEVVASLILSHGTRHVWSAREIAFAKTVSQIVALIFAMHESKRTVQRLDCVSQSIFVLGQTGHVVYANLAARRLADSTESVPSLPFALPPLTGVGDHHQIRYQDRDYEVFRTRLPGEEILIRIDDVTARNAAMADAAALEVQLKESAKLQAMGQMASGVAHDFNNILGAITGFAQALHRKLHALPEEANFVDRIIGVCKKGQAMTREILDIARTASTEREPVDLSQLIGNDIHELQGANEARAVVTVLQPDGPLPVRGNAAQLSQLVQNLVVNATHACEGADGRITVSGGLTTREGLRKLAASVNTAQERMLGVVTDASQYCYLRVADNGHGIPPEVLDHIFEPFFTTKDRRKGSGLGLVVVHGVVDTHGGCCHVRSEAGKGTVFTIYLPLLEPAAIAAA